MERIERTVNGVIAWMITTVPPGTVWPSFWALVILLVINMVADGFKSMRDVLSLDKMRNYWLACVVSLMAEFLVR